MTPTSAQASAKRLIVRVAKLRMSHFASTETDCNLDAVAVLQKLFSLIYFCFKVVRIDLQGETDLL